MTDEEMKRLRELCEAVRTRNASAKFGHPKYTANVTSAEAFAFCSGIPALLSELERLTKERDALYAAKEEACGLASSGLYSGGRLRDDQRTLETFDRIAALRKVGRRG